MASTQIKQFASKFVITLNSLSVSHLSGQSTSGDYQNERKFITFWSSVILWCFGQIYIQQNLQTLYGLQLCVDHGIESWANHFNLQLSNFCLDFDKAVILSKHSKSATEQIRLPFIKDGVV